MDNRKKVIVIAGPTAVGKTAAAIAVARHFQTGIISADARQVFREMTIGTAKPSAEELQAVHHHFINSHSITQSYDAAAFGAEALDRIHELHRTRDVVILCGGSGLYIRAVLEGFDNIPEVAPDIRLQLKRDYEQGGLEALQRKMNEIDPEHFQRIDSQNPQRLMRALEVAIGTGRSIASFQQRTPRTHTFDVIRIGLELPREELYRRIDARVDTMVADGLFEEAAALYPYRSANALQTVGYREVFEYMEKKYDRAEAIRLIKQHTRQYAKRQLTWFKRDPGMTWLHPANINDIIDVASR